MHLAKELRSYGKLKERKNPVNCSADNCFGKCTRIKTTFCLKCYAIVFAGHTIHVKGILVRRCSKCSYEGPDDEFSGLRGRDTKCCARCLKKNAIWAMELTKAAGSKHVETDSKQLENVESSSDKSDRSKTDGIESKENTQKDKNGKKHSVRETKGAVSLGDNEKSRASKSKPTSKREPGLACRSSVVYDRNHTSRCELSLSPSTFQSRLQLFPDSGSIGHIVGASYNSVGRFLHSENFLGMEGNVKEDTFWAKETVGASLLKVAEQQGGRSFHPAAYTMPPSASFNSSFLQETLKSPFHTWVDLNQENTHATAALAHSPVLNSILHDNISSQPLDLGQDASKGKNRKREASWSQYPSPKCRSVQDCLKLPVSASAPSTLVLSRSSPAPSMNSLFAMQQSMPHLQAPTQPPLRLSETNPSLLRHLPSHPSDSKSSLLRNLPAQQLEHPQSDRHSSSPLAACMSSHSVLMASSSSMVANQPYWFGGLQPVQSLLVPQTSHGQGDQLLNSYASSQKPPPSFELFPGSFPKY